MNPALINRRPGAWIGPCLVALCTAAVIGSPAHLRAQGSESALRFFGTGTGQQDRVRIPIDDDAAGPDASAPCDVGAGSFTLDWWMRGNLADNDSGHSGGDVETFDFSWINGNIIIDRDLFGGSERDWGVSIAGGFVRWGTGRGDAVGDNDNTIEGNVNVLDGNWHHVAVTRDSATGIKRIYVDGVPDFASSAGASNVDISYPDNGAPGQATPWGPYLVLAAEKHDAGPSYPSFNGFVDELRIWSVARTQADIAADFDRVIAYDASGLVAYYRFEEGSGTAVADSSTAGSPMGQLIAGVPGNGEWASYANDPNNTAPVSSGSLPPGFARSTVATGLDEPTQILFTPDGRLFIGQRNGIIRVYENGSLLPEPLIQINVDTLNGERGLVGLTLNPDFATNGYLYAYYTTSEPRNRVGRFTVVGNSASPASEVLIWQNPDLAADFHHGGAIAFGVHGDDHLYIATGDQFNSGNAQDLSNQHGKLLRVEADGSIPPKNPALGNPPAVTAIWAYGLRNPFRIAIDLPTGNLWIGDVGGNSFDSWEEVNRGTEGANYGWPQQEGAVCSISDCSTLTFPAFTYQHNDPSYYEGIVQGSITLGPVYRASQFPPGYQGNLFLGDYANRWIRRLIFDGSGNVIADPLFMAAPDAGTVVDLKVGPDAALYFVTVGTPWSGNPDAGAVYRIAFIGSSNQPPMVAASADPTSGPEPLLVNFNSTGSFDPDGAPESLTFAWTFGDGGTSDLPNPSHTYVNPGLYLADLTVSDGADSTSSQPIPITVGVPPIGTITQPPLGTTYRAGDTISFAGTAEDLEDGSLPAPAFTWQVFLVHAAHTHPFLGPLKGVTSGNFSIPATGHAPENTYYEVRLTITDSDGLTHTSARTVTPETAVVAFNTSPSGIPILLDGEFVNTPRDYVSLIGFQHAVEAQSQYSLGGVPYEFQCWSHGAAQTHTFVTPPSGAGLTAMYEASTGQLTVEAPVSGNAWDADYFPAFGEELRNFYDAFGLCTGREASGDWQAAAAFVLPIEQGAQVINAVLRLQATADQSGSPTAEIRAYDIADVSAFNATHTHELAQHHPLSATSASWVFPTFIPGEEYESPDLTPLVQSVLDRTDWETGNRIGIVLDGSPSPEGTWRCFRDFTSGMPARLVVVYAIQSTPSCCGTTCDDGLFCNGSETCTEGTCLPGSDPCPGQTCDEVKDRCVECVTDNECNDATTCTLDLCSAGKCTFMPNSALCPNDGLYCNGSEVCDPVMDCVSTGSPCLMGECDEVSDSCLPPLCSAPAMAALGGRVVQVAPAAGSQPIALRLAGDPQNSSVACVNLYVQEDGELGPDPVFRLPAQWGSVVLRNEAVIPDTTYQIQGNCGNPGTPNLTPPAAAATWAFGDVDGNAIVDVDDIICELAAFSGDYGVCSLDGTDLMSCTPNGKIDVDDILAVLEGFVGNPYSCPVPCP